MALKISQLTSAPALSGDELFEIAESGSSRSVPASGVLSYIRKTLDRITDSNSYVEVTNDNKVRIITDGIIALAVDENQTVYIPSGAGIIAGSGNNKILINPYEGIEISRPVGNGYIDFKSASAEDYDCRIVQASNGLAIYTGGDGSAVLCVNFASNQDAYFYGNIVLPNDVKYYGTEFGSTVRSMLWIAPDDKVYCGNLNNEAVLQGTTVSINSTSGTAVSIDDSGVTVSNEVSASELHATNGYTGSFLASGGQTVTVKNGIITSVA